MMYQSHPIYPSIPATTTSLTFMNVSPSHGSLNSTITDPVSLRCMQLLIMVVVLVCDSGGTGEEGISDDLLDPTLIGIDG